jgi:hypothetical protein
MDYVPDVNAGCESRRLRSAGVTLRRDASDSRHDRVQLGLGAGALVTGPDPATSIEFPDSLEHLVDECP